MNIKLLLLFVSLFVIQYPISAQKQFSFGRESENLIFNQLDAKSKKVILDLKKDMERADELMEVADKYYKELFELREKVKKLKNNKKRYRLLKKMEKIEHTAITNRVEALDNYHNVVVKKYHIYKRDIRKFNNENNKALTDSINEYEKLAYNVFEDADIKAQIAEHTVDREEQFRIYTQTFIIEQIGLLYMHKIYALFLNWSSTLKQNIDKEIIALKKNEPLNVFDVENITTQQKLVKDTVIYKERIVYDTVIIQKKHPEIVYSVQIAASKVPLKISELKKIYHADNMINTSIENGWYKYYVGLFLSYKSAQRFKTEIGIKDAFIVAYKNNQRINIAQALKENGK